MPEQALYLKWRPLGFTDVVGQEHVIRTLRNSMKANRIRHAYLFSGPRGTGKTTTARLLAKAVNCTHEDMEQRPCNECAACVAVNEGRFLDLIEIDAASHTGVDDVRELRDRIAFSPAEGRYKVYIIDEVHRFSANAFDALLKTLEEPPDHALFVLATTEIDKVPATIKSRCLPFEFRRLSLTEVTDRLAFIAEQEGLKIERAALELIAREGTGSVRDSISLLDQVVADPSEEITLELTQRILGTASARAVRELVEALLERSVARGLHIINSAIDSGSDPRQFGKQMVEHLRAILVTQTAGADLVEASQDDRELFSQQANSITRSGLLRVIRHFSDAINTSHSGWQPQLALELAFIESLQEPEKPVQQVIQQVVAPAGGASPASAQKDEPVEELVLAGKPPIIDPAVVQRKWADAQRLIHDHKEQAPGNLPNLMEHTEVMAVDGDIVVVGVKGEIYLTKLRDTTRTKWVERAISRVTDSALRVKFVSATTRIASDSGANTPAAEDIDDPLLSTALELGGEIKPDTDE